MMTDTTPNKSQFTREDYQSTHSKMVQSFGSERAKRALSAAKRNKMDSSLLEGTLASALDYADGEMKKADDNGAYVYNYTAGIYVLLFNSI